MRMVTCVPVGFPFLGAHLNSFYNLYCIISRIGFAVPSSRGFSCGLAIFGRCHFVYWCLSFSLVLSRLCCQFCCHAVLCGRCSGSLLGLLWQACKDLVKERFYSVKAGVCLVQSLPDFAHVVS